MSNTTAISELHDITMKLLESDEDLRNTYEHTLRDSIANGNLQQLLRGTVDSSLIHHSMTTALQRTSEEASSLAEELKDLRLRDLGISLWNPAVSCLIKERKAPIPSTPSNANHRSSKLISSDERRKHLKSACVKETSTPTFVASLHTTEFTHLKELETQSVVYYPKFCDKTGCEFCRRMFSSLAITKCQDHPPCAKDGWYPHAGKSLLKMVARSHSSGKPFVTRKAHNLSVDVLSGALIADDSKDESDQMTAGPSTSVPSFRGEDLENDAYGSMLSLEPGNSWANVVENNVSRSGTPKRCRSEPPATDPSIKRGRKIYNRRGSVIGREPSP